MSIRQKIPPGFAEPSPLPPDRQGELDPRYLGFFRCFNDRLFFEAHEVLEELWLPIRRSPEGDFYKGLIQLAGAFVHFQKARLDPARRLLLLARTNLQRYAPTRHQIDIHALVTTIEHWLNRAAHMPPAEVYKPEIAPRLHVIGNFF